MNKFLFYLLLLNISFITNAQKLPPRILIEGIGLNSPSGITGSVTVRVVSVQAEYDKSAIINVSSPSLSAIAPKIGNNYRIIISNNTNKIIGYTIGQISGLCSGKPKAAALGNGSEVIYRNGYDLPIDVGQTIEIYNNLSIGSHDNYQQACSDGFESYELGGIYLSLFRADVNRLKISETFLNTSRDFYIYKIPNGCHDFSGDQRRTKIFINGKEHKQNSKDVIFDAYGLRVYRFAEGFFSVGDVIWAEDECGSLRSNSTIVSEDYAYLSIPPNGSFEGNGITEDDTLSPTGRLEKPLVLKQCQPITNIGSHNLSKLLSSVPANFPDNQPFKVGEFFLNGKPIKSEDFITRANAYRREVGIISDDGSVNHFGGSEDFSFISKKYFVVTPQDPIVYEYKHNGFDLIKWDFAHYIILGENFGFRFIHNNDVTLRYMSGIGEIEEEKLFGDFTNARYKIVFDGTFIRLFINDELKKEFKQKVTFTASGGEISVMNNLDLNEKVNFMPSDTGYHYIRAKINKVQIVTQKTYIQPNKPTIFPNQDTISIFKGQSLNIGIQESSCQGIPVWSNGSNQTSLQVNPSIDTEYSVFCRFPNGCNGSLDKIFVKVIPPLPNVSVSKSDICIGQSILLTASGCTGSLLWSNGQTSDTITVHATSSQLLSAKCIANGRTSPSKYVSIKIQ